MITRNYDVQSDGIVKVHHLTPEAKPSDLVILFCHPTGFCGLCFASITAHLRGFNVFSLDMRSHGASERKDVTSWSGFAKDLKVASEFVLSSTNSQKIIGIGISSGSSAHILNNQEMVDIYSGLFLCEPILFPPGADLKDRDSLAKSAENRRSQFKSKDEAFSKFSRKGLSELNPSSLGLYCAHGLRSADDGVTLCCNKDDEKNIYLSGGANGVYDALSNIKVPTVIVNGAKSHTIDLKYAQLIANKIGHAKVETMADSGHFTLLDNPLAGAKSITKFAKSLSIND